MEVDIQIRQHVSFLCFSKCGLVRGIFDVGSFNDGEETRYDNLKSHDIDTKLPQPVARVC